MAKYLSNRDGGSLDEKGLYYFLDKLFPGQVITGFNVTQQDTPGLGVKVNVNSDSVASALIPSGDDYPYHVFMDAAENITLATADGSNPRIDLIVAYVDLSVVDDTNPNNPGAFLIDNVTGTPAGSPAVPNDAAIHAVIGASNPYIILARVAIAAGATTITNSNITDVRSPTSNKFSGARVKRATNQTGILASTITTIAFTGEDFDTDSYHDNSTNNSRLTVPATGYYSLGCHVEWDAWDVSATAYRLIINLFKNGVQQEDLLDVSISNNGGETALTVNTFLQATAGDYFEFKVFQATPNTRALTTNTHAWVRREGA